MQYNFKFLFLCSSVLLTSCGNHENSSTYTDYASKKNTQDMPYRNAESPLTGLSTFTVYSFSPIHYEVMKTNLQKYTTVKKIKFIEETKEGIQFNEISFDPMLIFETKEVCSVNGKTLPFIRASLSVESHIIVEKTKEKCDSYIWTKNCFIPGDAYGKHGQELITKSLDFLLELFMKDYLAANLTKPVFNLVDPSAKAE